MNYKYLLYRDEERVGYITLNNPQKRNALSLEMLEELIDLFKAIARERKVHVVVIKGAGKVFSSGHDLTEILGHSPLEVERLFQKCMEMMYTLRSIPQPVIAQVHGVATAAGCQLVAACDLAVAEEGARFATPGVKIGIFCSTPIVFVSRAVGRKRAFEMGITGEFITAQQALEWGLVNRVVPLEELEEATRELAQSIARYSLLVLESGKRMFYQQLNMEDFQALNYATEVISLYSAMEDCQEGIRAFFEKREPEWRDK